MAVIYTSYEKLYAIHDCNPATNIFLRNLQIFFQNLSLVVFISFVTKAIYRESSRAQSYLPVTERLW